MEDSRHERIEPGHHEIRQRLFGLLDDFYGFIVIAGYTDIVVRSFVLVDFFHEEGDVRLVLSLSLNDIAEVGVEDVVARH